MRRNAIAHPEVAHHAGRGRFAAAASAVLDAGNRNVDVAAEQADDQRPERRMRRQAERIEGVIDRAKLEHREQQPEHDEENYRVEKEEWCEEHGRDDTKPSPRRHALWG